MRAVADLLNGIDKEMSKSLLARLEERNAQLGSAIRKKMFSFEDLGRLAAADLQRVLREVDSANLGRLDEVGQRQPEGKNLRLDFQTRRRKVCATKSECSGRFASRTSKSRRTRSSKSSAASRKKAPSRSTERMMQH